MGNAAKAGKAAVTGGQLIDSLLDLAKTSKSLTKNVVGRAIHVIQETIEGVRSGRLALQFPLELDAQALAGRLSAGFDPTVIKPRSLFKEVTGSTKLSGSPIAKLDDLSSAGNTLSSGPNRIYSARELIRRAEEPGPYHNFPESFNDNIFAGTRTAVSDDYVLYTTRGQINLPGDPIYAVGQKGVRIGDSSVQSITGYTPSRVVEGIFEIGVKPSTSGRTEVIMHRFFRPDSEL